MKNSLEKKNSTVLEEQSIDNRVVGVPRFLFITVRQRSFLEGNIFTSVCQEFCAGGCLPQCMLGYTPRQTLPWADTPSRHPPADTPWADTTPRSDIPWIDTPGTTPLWANTHTPGRHPPYSRRLLQRTVRNLLEWILVVTTLKKIKSMELNGSSL